MGIYLSTPSTEVELEEGSGGGVRFVVGEMQGWRKNMEDAHIALTELSSETLTSAPKFSLFAVFDGHGGKEVAKFSKIHYPQLLLEQLVANEGDVAMALRESFHRIDEELEDPQYATLLKELRSLPNPCDKAPPRNPPRNITAAVLEDSDSDSEMDTEEYTAEKKNANQGNDGTMPSLFAEEDTGDEDTDPVLTTSDAVRMIREMLKKAAQRNAGGAVKKNGKHSGAMSKSEEDQAEDGAKGSVLSSEEGADGDAKDCDASMEADVVADEVDTKQGAEDKRTAKNGTSSGSKNGCSGLTVTMHENVEEVPADCKSEGNGKARHVNGTALAVPEVKDIAEDTSADPSPKPIHDIAAEDISPGAEILPAVATIASAVRKAELSDSSGNIDQSPVQASRKSPDGMMSCILKQHKIMAGCTAVVALHVGNQLYVANAGDSRGVLCRKGGQAYALSYDHKPQQEREMSRIVNAGGFVNAVGRINGNLNLSRSLGDLKYKQVVQCAREEQMITAEPDITLTQLQEGDRFFILACDGVWDCLSNQQACDFVSQRLDKGLDVATITKEVLHHCLASDTASAAGVGCDNMTFLLVLLNQ